jgi:hypothetical protein
MLTYIYNLQRLRTRLDLLLGHFLLFRSESRWMVELSELSCQRWPDSEGPSPCWAVVFASRKSKTNQAGRRFYMGAIRHQNPELCTVGALAQYFYWRWHMSGEPAPTFQRQEDWYNIKVLRGEDREAELLYPTQYQDCLLCLQDAGVTAEMVTHCMRASGAQEAERLGVPDSQVCSFTYIILLML